MKKGKNEARYSLSSPLSLAGHRGASRLSPSSLPSPKQAKAHAMPSHNRLRLTMTNAEHQSYTRQRSPEEAVRCDYFRVFLKRALKHADLMAQSQVSS